MNLNQIMSERTIYLDIDVKDKESLFNFVTKEMEKQEVVSDAIAFKNALYERESLSPTGMGEKWAIPHGLDKSVKKASVFYVRLKKEIPYESLEGDTAQHFFFIAVPESLSGDHVKILSHLATLLMEDTFKKEIYEATNPLEAMNIINKYNHTETKQSQEVKESKHIVAVSACTTGIAHTYMAEKALMEKAEDMGINMRIEKQGAAGVEDGLTQTEIERADVVILAIEKGINENRFKDKEILKVTPGQAIKDPETVINDALSGKNTYIKKVSQDETESFEKESVKGVYQHLLAGVSYMIPIVVAGGLAIALSFAFGITAFENEGSLPWALFEIGSGSALALMFPVLAGFIAYDIADKPGFAPGIIGGMIANRSGSGFIGAIIAGYMAGYLARFINKKVKFPKSIQGLKNIVILPVVTTLVVGLFLLFVIAKPVVGLQNVVAQFLNDLSNNNAGIVVLSLAFSVFYFDLGGPISKMVYSFAVALLADQIYTPMAAVMIIGMIPPLSMAIATMLRPNMFKKDEQEAGKTALILGMSFITEGAIPFAIAHPKQAIPSFMLGGFVGSVISLALNIGVTAPHGGLFLAFIPNAITNPILFIIALLIGSVISAMSMLFLMNLSHKKQ